MIECVLQMVNKNIAMSLTIIVVILVNKYFRKANYQTKYLNYLIATVGLIVPLQFIWRINTSASNLSYSTIENVKRLVNSSNTFITDNLQTSVKLSTSFQLDLATIAMIVYILGILILTIIIGIKYFSLIRYINHWRVDDQRLNNEFRQLCLSLHIEKVELCVIPNAKSAFSYGLLHHHVVVDNHYSVDDNRLIMMHELTHIKRYDIYANFLAVIACVIYWYNPLVWILMKRLRSAYEYACDEQLSEYLDNEQQVLFARLLLRISKNNRVSVNKLALYVSPTKKSLKERIEIIMRIQTKKKSIGLAVLISLLTIVVGCSKISGISFENDFLKPLLNTTIYQSENNYYIDNPYLIEILDDQYLWNENATMSLSEYNKTVDDNEVRYYQLNQIKINETVERNYPNHIKLYLYYQSNNDVKWCSLEFDMIFVQSHQISVKTVVELVNKYKDFLQKSFVNSPYNSNDIDQLSVSEVKTWISSFIDEQDHKRLIDKEKTVNLIELEFGVSQKSNVNENISTYIIDETYSAIKDYTYMELYQLAEVDSIKDVKIMTNDGYAIYIDYNGYVNVGNMIQVDDFYIQVSMHVSLEKDIINIANDKDLQSKLNKCVRDSLDIEQSIEQVTINIQSELAKVLKVPQSSIVIEVIK